MLKKYEYLENNLSLIQTINPNSLIKWKIIWSWTTATISDLKNNNSQRIKLVLKKNLPNWSIISVKSMIYELSTLVILFKYIPELSYLFPKIYFWLKQYNWKYIWTVMEKFPNWKWINPWEFDEEVKKLQKKFNKIWLKLTTEQINSAYFTNWKEWRLWDITSIVNIPAICFWLKSNDKLSIEIKNLVDNLLLPNNLIKILLKKK